MNNDIIKSLNKRREKLKPLLTHQDTAVYLVAKGAYNELTSLIEIIENESVKHSNNAELLIRQPRRGLISSILSIF